MLVPQIVLGVGARTNMLPSFRVCVGTLGCCPIANNNEKEKQIEEKRTQLQRAFMDCKGKEEEIDSLQERLRKLQDKYQPAQLSAELRDSAYALEDASEAIARVSIMAERKLVQ